MPPAELPPLPRPPRPAGGAPGRGRPDGEWPAAGGARFAVALVLATVAVALTVLLAPVLTRAVFLVAYAAVGIAAWYGGTRPGLLAGLVCVLGVDYFLIPPVGRLRPADPNDYVPMAVFVGVSVLVGRLADSLRAARAAALRQADDAGRAAAELEQANMQLQEQAVELEAQADELHAAYAQLEARTADAEASRRAAEAQAARVAEVLEGTTDAYFALDGELRVVAVNGAMERGVGIPRERLLGGTFWELFPGAVGTVFEHHYRRVAAERTEAHFTHDYSDGRLELVVEVDAYPAGDGGLAVFWRDVSERVRADAERERLLVESRSARHDAEEARRAAEGAGRLKAEFLATMSHEFRTPLNAILGYAQLLDLGVLGPATPAQHAHLARLQASARHLLQLVDDVLDVAKVDADRLTVRHDPLATGSAVASALALVQPQGTAKGIRIEDQGCTGAGVAYVGDEHRVRQILINLLANAVKFTPPGGAVTVSCGAAAEPDPGVQPGGPNAAPDARPGRAWAYLRVRDTGPGLAPELQPRLFEPFIQGDGALTRAHGGTGLGLAISRRLARLMGGDLVIDSRPGAGATFTLWLPAPREAVGEAGTDAPDGAGRHTPAARAAADAAPEDAPLDPAAYPVLHALGARLAARAEHVAARYAAALRRDGRFPGADSLPAVQLRDHATPLVGLLASQLMILGETRGSAPELLGDGAQMQRVMAELHGAQRHRLGWSEADIEREVPLLAGEVVGELRTALQPETGTATAAAAHGSAEAAARYAEDVVRHVLAQSMGTALRSYRFARAAATP